MRRADKARRDRRTVLGEVDYRQFVADPLGTVRNVFETFGLELTDDVERQMCTWIESHTQNQHGGHSYDLASLGVAGDLIAENFGPYIEEHALS